MTQCWEKQQKQKRWTNDSGKAKILIVSIPYHDVLTIYRGTNHIRS